MGRLESLRRFLQVFQGVKSPPEHAVKVYLRGEGLPAPRGLYIPRGAPEPDLSLLSFPLAAKVSSSRIRSKTDVGGVRLGLADADAVSRAIADLMGIENAEGVIVEEQAPPGIEVIAGGIIDAQFGPVVMFGLGGVFVELFHDVAFAPAPMSKGDAFRLMERIKGYRLLTGVRGNPPCDREALADILMTVSELTATGLLEEIDLNPVALYPVGAMILDAKILARGV